MPGVGKTQIAVEYSYRFADAYRLVWWLRAHEPATLRNDYANLARALGLNAEDQSSVPSLAESARSWLEQQTNWLLVFDNGRADTDLLEFIPRSTRGHVLATSLSPNWSAIGLALSVPVFQREDSVRFLSTRAGQSDTLAAGELARELGNHPLAMEQAAAYIAETAMPIRGYLSLLRTRREEISGEERAPPGYGAKVDETLSLAVTQAENDATGAVDLLRFYAYFAAEAVPANLAQGLASVLPPPLRAVASDEVLLHKAIGALRQCSLLDTRSGSHQVHALVQRLIRDRLTPDEQRVWIDAAVSVLADSAPVQAHLPENWSAWARVLPHAITAAELAIAANFSSSSLAVLLNNTGLYLMARADYRAALDRFQQAFEYFMEIEGRQQENTALALLNIGRARRQLRDFPQATAALRDAEAIFRVITGTASIGMVAVLDELGAVLRAEGELGQALDAHEGAVRVAEGMGEPEGIDLASLRSRRDMVLQLQTALGARGNLSDYKTARAALNEGIVLERNGNVSAAIVLYQQALEIEERLFEDEHWEIAAVLELLGEALWRPPWGNVYPQRQYARDTLHKAADVYERTLGLGHPTSKRMRERVEKLWFP